MELVSLTPSRCISRPQRAAALGAPVAAPVDADFVVDEARRARVQPLVQRFDGPARALLAPRQRVSAPARQLIGAFQRDLAATLHGIDKPYRAFIGALDASAGTGDHYALRRLALFAACGELESWHAFTFEKRTGDGNLWRFVEDPRNWLPQRLGAVQYPVAARMVVDCLATSAAIGAVPRPAIEVTSGPFGAGKTTLLRRRHGAALRGLAGSDFAKDTLRKNLDTVASSAMLHVECSQVAFAVARDLSATLTGTLVVDSSMARAYDLQRFLDSNPRAFVRVFAVHVPLHVCMLRVLMRPVSGAESRIKARDVIDGWRKTVVSRQAITDIARHEATRVSYDLTVSDAQGVVYAPTLRIADGATSVLDATRWQAAMSTGDDAPAQRVLVELLSDRACVAATDAARMGAALRARDMLGMTLGDALDAHARREEPWPGEEDI